MTVKEKLEKLIDLANLGLDLIKIIPEPSTVFEMLDMLFVIYNDEDVYLDALQKVTDNGWKIVENKINEHGVESLMVNNEKKFVLRVDIENQVRKALKEQYADKLQGYLLSVQP